MRNQPPYKFLKNWSYAINGLRDIWANESSFRIEVCLFLVLAISLLIWEFGLVLNLFLIFSMLIVLVVECLNSAIERVVDLASPNFHTLAGAAKDAASAAVMLCNIVCAILWIWAILVKFEVL